MNWDAIGAIGEILGVLVVVATLVYLSRQISQQATAVTSENMGSWLSDYNSLVLRLLDSHEASDIFRRGLTDFEVLGGTDQMRFHAWMITHTLNAQNMYLQQEDDIMHKQITEAILAVNASIFKLKGGNQWWQCAKKTLDPTFVDDMDERVENATPATDAFPWFVLYPGEMERPPNKPLDTNA